MITDPVWLKKASPTMAFFLNYDRYRPMPVEIAQLPKSLWSGWLFMGPEYRVYYAGDTGFCREEFEKVGKKFGPIDLVITPIGCYKPDEYMESQHMHPARSVEIFKLTKARHLLGVHWGTFNMKAFEHFYDPFLDLRYAVKQEIRLRNELRKYSKGGNLSKGISDIVSEIKSKFLSPNAKENALTEFTSTVDYSLNGKDLLDHLKRCQIFTLEHGQTWSIEDVETYEEDFCTPYA